MRVGALKMALVAFGEDTSESLLPLSPREAMRKGSVSTQQEGSHLQAWKRAVTRTQPHCHPNLGLPAPELRENKFLLFKPLSL